MKTTVQKVKLNPNQRMIVVSDIHGHLDFLVQLLRKVDYSGDDVLVIVGDLVDKRGRTVCGRCSILWSLAGRIRSMPP